VVLSYRVGGCGPAARRRASEAQNRLCQVSGVVSTRFEQGELSLPPGSSFTVNSIPLQRCPIHFPALLRRRSSWQNRSQGISGSEDSRSVARGGEPPPTRERRRCRTRDGAIFASLNPLGRRRGVRIETRGASTERRRRPHIRNCSPRARRPSRVIHRQAGSPVAAAGESRGQPYRSPQKKDRAALADEPRPERSDATEKSVRRQKRSTASR